MMTREEILAIDQYCQEHKISYKQRLDELDIPFWNFYKAKRKYRKEDESSRTGCTLPYKESAYHKRASGLSLEQ